MPQIKSIPTHLEVAGKDLESVMAKLREQGAHVSSMKAIENGLWLLSLVWSEPDAAKTSVAPSSAPALELLALRQKLASIESEIEGNNSRLATINKRQIWLAGQRSDAMKCVARLTLAKTAETENNPT